MLSSSYPYTNLKRRLSICVVLIALTGLLSACGGNVLSDLDALAKQSILNNSETIEVTAQLSVEQLVSPEPVISDSDAVAQLYVNLASNEISGHVNITPSQNAMVQQVQIRRGFGGQNGDPVLDDLVRDTVDSNQWYIKDNSLLSDEVVELLLSGELYVLVTTVKHKNGELRGQLLLDGQELLITELSGADLIPQVTTSASGKAFLTPIGFDGTAQAIVRVAGITQPNIVLFRANNPNTTETGQVLYPLEERQDFWELPSGKFTFGQKEFNDISNGKLMFKVTSADFKGGEIGGRISFSN